MMRANKPSRLLSSLLVSLIAVNLLAGCDTDQEKQESESRREKQAERFAAGPYLAKESRISSTETVKLVIIPHNRMKYYDVKCIVYENTALSQTNMICPDASADGLTE